MCIKLKVPTSQITKETLVYRHSTVSYLNPTPPVFEDVKNCNTGFD